MGFKYKNNGHKYTLKNILGVISHYSRSFIKTPFFGVLALFIVFTFIGSNIAAHSASAQAGNNGGNVTMNADTPPNIRAQSYTYWKLTSKCVQSHMRNAIKTTAGSNGATTPKQSGNGGGVGTPAGEWFDDLSAFGQVYPDGQLTCAQVMQKAITLWGFGDGPTLLKAMGYTFNANVPQWESSTQDGNQRFENFKNAVLGRVGNVVNLATQDAMHLLYLNAFKAADPFCQGKKIVKFDDADQTQKNWATANNGEGSVQNGVRYVTITEVEGGGTVRYIYTYDSDPDTSGQLWRYRGAGQSHDGVVESYKCSELVKMINSSAGALASWNANPAHQTTPVGSNDTPAAPGTTPEGGETSCVIEAVGWLVCPVVNFLAGLADGAFGFLASAFLETPAQAFQTDQPTYRVWIIMRNIANILFVIAFLFIIFSQLTGQGVSNYGIKKMLPRLVIAAILVNVSFFISQLAIDISNILGYTINNVFEGISGQVMGDTYNASASLAATGNTFTDVSVAILAGAATGVALYALLSTFIPIIIAAVLALILMLFILIARQAIIILLVALSPIAFVALLLPNTEKFFKQWRKMLVAMLLLFPIIALVFGASSLASAVLQGAFTGAYTGEGSNWFGQIVASAVLVIPLFVVPVLLKKSLDGIPVLGQMANKWQNKANGRLSGKLGDGYKNSAWGRGRTARKAARQAYKDRKFAKSVTAGGFRAKVAGVAAGGVGGVFKTDQAKYTQQALERNAIAINNKARDEDINTAAALMLERHDNATTQISDIAQELETAIDNNDITKARAAQSILLRSGGAGLDTLHDTLAKAEGKSAGMRDSAVGKSLRGALNEADLKGKDNALAEWAYAQTVIENGQSVYAEVDKTTGQLVAKRVNNQAVSAGLTTAKAREAGAVGIEANAGIYGSLSSTELGGQRMKVLQSAEARGSLTPAQAQAVLQNEGVMKDMDIGKENLFRRVAGLPEKTQANPTGAAPSTATASGTATTTSSSQSGSQTTSPSTAGQTSGGGPATGNSGQTAGQAGNATAGQPTSTGPTPGPASSGLPASQRFNPASSQPAADGTSGRLNLHNNDDNQQPPSNP